MLNNVLCAFMLNNLLCVYLYVHAAWDFLLLYERFRDLKGVEPCLYVLGCIYDHEEEEEKVE